MVGSLEGGRGWLRSVRRPQTVRVRTNGYREGRGFYLAALLSQLQVPEQEHVGLGQSTHLHQSRREAASSFPVISLEESGMQPVAVGYKNVPRPWLSSCFLPSLISQDGSHPIVLLLLFTAIAAACATGCFHLILICFVFFKNYLLTDRQYPSFLTLVHAIGMGACLHGRIRTRSPSA